VEIEKSRKGGSHGPLKARKSMAQGERPRKGLLHRVKKGGTGSGGRSAKMERVASKTTSAGIHASWGKNRGRKMEREGY